MEALTHYDTVLRYFPYGIQRGDEWETKCPNPACPNPEKHFYVNLNSYQAKCHRCDLAFGSFQSLVNYIRNGNILPLKVVPIQPLVFAQPEEETILSNPHFPFLARLYLSKRGIPIKIIKEYHLENGMGSWKDYVIFTCANTGYRYGRRFKNDGDKYLRYRFPKGIEKKHSLFTHPDFWLPDGKPYFGKTSILVEGAFDAMAIDLQAKNPCAIAIMGSFLSKSQEIALRSFSNLWVWLDPDAYSKAREIGRKLTAWGINVHVLNLTKEPGDSSSEEIQAVLNQLED